MRASRSPNRSAAWSSAAGMVVGVPTLAKSSLPSKRLVASK